MDWRQTALLAAALLAAAPAAGVTTTNTRTVKSPPYYHGQKPPDGAPAGHLPVIVAPGPPGTPEGWLPRGALEELAAAVERRLVELAPTTPVADLPASPAAGAPDVYLGCELETPAADECLAGSRSMTLAITSGTKRWRAAAAEAARQAGVERLLLLTVELAEHRVQQRGLRGVKEIRLGSGLVQKLPWLSSLDQPVQVLQLTGAVVDAEGKVLRAGAEGLYATRTELALSAIGGQRLMAAADVDRVRIELRREDLPERPLVWETALDALLAELLGWAPPGGR